MFSPNSFKELILNVWISIARYELRNEIKNGKSKTFSMSHLKIKLIISIDFLNNQIEKGSLIALLD